MQERKLVFFQGNTQYENTGDVLINKSFIVLIKKYAQLIINDKEMPDWYVASLGLTKEECISDRGSHFYLYLAGKALMSRLGVAKNTVYLIGGAPGHEFGSSVSKAVKNFIIAILYFILRVCGAQIFRLGFSIGPIGKAVGVSEKFRSVFMNQYFVRDSLSLSLCHQIGINKARFFPDLAWLYQPNRTTSFTKNKIVLSFRHSVLDESSDDQYLERLKANLFFMLQSVSEKYSIEVLYQVKRDLEFCGKLYDELKNVMPVTFRQEQVTLETAEAAYGGACCILTNRLHVALLGYKYGGLPLILTDSESHLKIKGIYTDAGMGYLLLDVNNGIEKNAHDFNGLLQNRDDIINKLNKKEGEYKQLAGTLLEEVFKK
ncbi:MAG: polysaccharide pyruvyl transferase family protein [Chitinophagaceae bacterium]|nr:polysaccharide pyruvyl transferase family protein [Chitinophagaceae bacterium]